MTEAPTSADAAIDPGEVAKFEAMAAEWWNPRGPHAPLHAMNPCRLAHAVDHIAAQHGRDTRKRHFFQGLEVLDIGCGGGLMSEPMARLGARVTGIDAAPASAPVARLHAEAQGLAIDYRTGIAADLAGEGRRFDVVLAMEVIEHVPDQPGFVAEIAGLLAPGGLAILSTLNRTPQAWALAIAGAEYLLGWLPRGTHDWRQFVTPAEIEAHGLAAGLETLDLRGMVFDPLAREWRLSTDLAVNYLAVMARAGG
ncbi:MAG: bifunctional 2-polyprenyl-6-hydroxyphenol methylase/3-demethylubiquinol 3-O-methyltransferase UbiG [Pseudomonadota bacterium]